MTPLDLAYDHYGDTGTAFVIAHGLFGSKRNWNAIGRKLAEDFSVYLLDLRNHGASPHSSRMDIPHLAADFRFFLDRQCIESAVFLGHSLGGKAAMWLALTEPDRVKGLIAADIAPVAYTHNFDEIYDAMCGLQLASVISRQDADEKLSHSIAHPGLRQFLLQNLTTGEQGYGWRVDLDILRNATPKLLSFPPVGSIKPYPGPVLFLRAENSSYLLPEHGATINRVFPQNEVELVENAGHWLNTDQPERILALLRRFADRVQQKQSAGNIS